MPRKAPPDVLCVQHAKIQKALCNIELCMQRDDPEAMIEAVLALRIAQDAVEVAMKQGMSMENRLLKYRTAIESLGFTRNKQLPK